MKQRFEKGTVPVPDNTASSLFAFIVQQLSPLSGAGEARATGRILLEHYAGVTPPELSAGQRVNQSELIRIYNAVLRLMEHEPLQYIIGETVFYGMRFRVTPAVLIPRPETEELVDMIIKENGRRNALKVLDVGTGSGCIPVTLAKHLLQAAVHACDISADALAVARENAAANDAAVHFVELDFLQSASWSQLPSVDLLVSNPPYIRPSEAESMAEHVTGHEPHLALFVPGENALVFYEAIADFCTEKLNPGGKIYLEINEALGPQTLAVFTRKGFANAELRKDMSGKERFIYANKPD